MSRPDDYRDEMLRQAISDREIERLINGDLDDGRLAVLAPFVDQLRSYAAYVPSDEAVARFAAAASRLAVEAPPQAKTETRRPVTLLRLRPQLAALGLVAVLFSTTTGVALAADGAAPGDNLYGLDRALERVGIGNGQTRERLDEANRLLDRGEARWALEHAAEVLQGTAADLEAHAALIEVIGLIPEDLDEETAAETQEEVAALLTFIGENAGAGVGADGPEFGEGVAEIARDLGGGPSSGTTTPTSLPPTTEGEEDQGSQGSPGVTSTSPAGPSSSTPGSGSGNGSGPPASVPPGSGPSGSGTPGSGPPGSGGPPQTGGPSTSAGGGSGNGGGNGPPGTGGGGNGSGPPTSLPSDTAPGRGNRP